METGKSWTFSEFNQFTNQIANYFDAQGLKKGDVVALLSNNCPEYIAFWLGLSKIGVVTALINYNLVGEPLGHSIRIANSKCLILSSEFQKSTPLSLLFSFIRSFKSNIFLLAVKEEIKNGNIDSNVKLYTFNNKDSSSSDTENLLETLKNASKLKPPKKDIDFKSTLHHNRLKCTFENKYCFRHSRLHLYVWHNWFAKSRYYNSFEVVFQFELRKFEPF